MAHNSTPIAQVRPPLEVDSRKRPRCPPKKFYLRFWGSGDVDQTSAKCDLMVLPKAAKIFASSNSGLRRQQGRRHHTSRHLHTLSRPLLHPAPGGGVLLWAQRLVWFDFNGGMPGLLPSPFCLSLYVGEGVCAESFQNEGLGLWVPVTTLDHGLELYLAPSNPKKLRFWF